MIEGGVKRATVICAFSEKIRISVKFLFSLKFFCKIGVMFANSVKLLFSVKLTARLKDLKPKNFVKDLFCSLTQFGGHFRQK